MSKNAPMPIPDESSDNAFTRYFRSARNRDTSARSPRPWLLAALAFVCAALVIVGSFGPWETFERVSETAPETTTEYGAARVDGLVSILVGVVAFVALLVALFWRGDDAAAWLAFGAMTLCALIGLLNWLMFAPPETSLNPGEQGTIIRVEWGLKLVGLAGATGAFFTWLVARQLYRD